MIGNITKIAIIGLGRAGQFHLRSIQQLDNVEVAYVVDPGIKRKATIVTQNNFKLLSDASEALQDDSLDAVIVSSPTHSHFSYIKLALEAGKHVFSEKPLGKTTGEIKYCFQLAKEQKKALYIGFQRRYDNNFRALKDSLSKLGTIRTVKTSSRDNPKPALDYLKISGNIFHDMLIHDFDMLIYLLGETSPKLVSAFGHAYDGKIAAIPDYDTVLVTIQYPNGLICSIDTSRTASYGYDQRIELFGDKGMAIVENQRNNTIQIHNKEGRLDSPINYSFPERYKDSYLAEIKDFLIGMKEGRFHNITLNECLLSHQIAEAAYLAAKESEVIDFDSFTNNGK